MSLPESAPGGESLRCGGAQGLDKRRGAQILASRSDEGGYRGETYCVASVDVKGAPRTCASDDRSLGHDAEGIVAGQRRPLEASGKVTGVRCSKLWYSC